MLPASCSKTELAALALAASLCGCAYQPWPTHAQVSQKPASPLKAPDGKALLVVAVIDAQGSGNGGYTVFERDGKVLQFPEEATAWTSVSVAPGAHRFYLRTWTSDFCKRVDANFAPGKVYVLALNPDVKDTTGILGHNQNIIARAMWQTPAQHNPAGALAFLPYITINEAAAKNELADHGGQVESCIAAADKAASLSPVPVGSAGYDAIEFVTK